MSGISNVARRLIIFPGFADTRHLHSVGRVLQLRSRVISILQLPFSGTAPRVTLGVNYSLSTILPRTWSKNVAFLLSNTLNALFLNISRGTLLEGFKDTPQFLLNNPIALQRGYPELEHAPKRLDKDTFLAKR